MLVLVDNHFINVMGGLIGLLQCHRDNGSICDKSQLQAREVSETLQSMERGHIGNKLELLEAYREKRRWDGGEGRVWNASKHLDAEDLIKKLEG